MNCWHEMVENGEPSSAGGFLVPANSHSSPNGMATATLCQWSATNIQLDQVEQAAAKLRAGEERTATRTSVVNLVVVTDNQEALNRAGSAMRRLGARHPGRTILALTIPDGRPHIDAEMRLFQSTAEGHSVWWEEIRLIVYGPAALHLDSIVLPLILNHLPLVVWFPGELPLPGNQLAQVADALLVDVRFAEPLGGNTKNAEAELGAISTLARVHTVTDLSWKRLTPWRELLAASFEPVAMRPFLQGVQSITVSAQPGPRRLLAGWLASRLDLRATQIELQDDLHAHVELRAASQGQSASVNVSRTQTTPSVSAEVTIDGEHQFTLTHTLPEHGLTWSLARALSDLRRDPIYEAALSAALRRKDRG